MKITIPLRYIQVGGHNCPRPVVDLEIWSSRLGWVSVPFLVDTGTTITIIPGDRATSLALAYRVGPDPIRIRVTGTNRRGHPSTMRVRFANFPQKEFSWPCLITEDAQPTASGGIEQAAAPARPLPCLLGTAGFLGDDFDMLIGASHVTLFHRHSWQHRNAGLVRALCYLSLGFALGLAMLFIKCRG